MSATPRVDALQNSLLHLQNDAERANQMRILAIQLEEDLTEMQMQRDDFRSAFRIALRAIPEEVKAP